MYRLPQQLNNKLTKRALDGTLRKLRLAQGIDFASNDYLGLSSSEQLKEKIIHRISGLKTIGATGSRLITGNSEYHQLVEQELAQVFHAEACLLFSSGYSLNIGLLSSIGHENSVFIIDQLAHASLKNGASLSKAKVYYYRHNDLNHLRERLGKIAPDKDIFVVTESIFSMDGDLVPLTDLIALIEEFQGHLILDEAHAFGTWGEQGLGLACESKLESKIFARIGTFGKAYGLSGAACFGSKQLMDYLTNFCHSFVYTTALSPIQLDSILESVRYQQDHLNLLSELNMKIQYLANKIDRPFHKTAIFPLLVPEKASLKQLEEKLKAEGFQVNAIYSPTVKKGTERLRICLHAFNAYEDIDRLTDIIKNYLGDMNEASLHYRN